MVKRLSGNIEEWRDVVGWEGLYQVSNLGRVKSVDRFVLYKTNKIDKPRRKVFTKGKLLKPRYVIGKYKTVFLRNGDVKKCCSVHRLVAGAFLKNPNNYPCVNHKDEDKWNNNVSNLEWCTYKYNSDYSNTQKRCAESRKKPICQYDKELNLIGEYKSAVDAGNALGFSNLRISECCRGKTQTYKGYIWTLKGEEPSYREKRVRCDSKNLTLLNAKNEVISTFRSAREASIKTGRCVKYILKMAKLGILGKDELRWVLN